MGRIIFSLFILWGYLSNSLGGSRPGSFPLRGYVPPTLSSWCDTLHSSQIIGHSPHSNDTSDRIRHRHPTPHPQRTPTNTHSDPERITSHTSRATAPEHCRRSCAALWETHSHQPPGVRFLLRKRTQKTKHVCV